MASKEKPQAEDEAEAGSPAVDEEIRRRAYEISQSEGSGTPEENWHRAEREVTHRQEPAT
jgi:hypothetical protein